jgi:hypothetical protein
MANEIDAIEQAVIETNREIAAEAWDQEHVELDHTGDRTPETVGEGLEGQIEDEEADAEAETEEVEAEAAETPEGEEKPAPAPKSGEQQPAPKPEGRVPSARLREQTEKVRTLETERDALKAQLETSTNSTRQEVAALKNQLEGVLAALRQQPQPPKSEAKPEAETIPDMFEDPKGYQEYQDKKWETRLNGVVAQVQKDRVASSFADAHSRHGEAFPKAMEAISAMNTTDPAAQALVRNIWSSPNPGEALIQWHKRNETLREVGDDPAKYREKIETEARTKLMADPEFRKQLIADLQAEASGGANGKPNTITRLPKSLNNSPGGSRAGFASEVFDGSPQAVAESAWRD